MPEVALVTDNFTGRSELHELLRQPPAGYGKCQAQKAIDISGTKFLTQRRMSSPATLRVA